MKPLRVFIGFDPRERDAYMVAEHSLRRHASIAVDVQPIVLEQMIWKRLYKRTTTIRDGRLWDEISGAPMATEFALTRFLVPHLAAYEGWALFCDCDFLFRADVAELVELMDPRLAALVVKHDYEPREEKKMDDQIQTAYARKNWSSFMLWNCSHDAHAGVLQRINRWRGLRLHQLRWIPDDEIGALPKGWNWLDGTSQLELWGKPVSPKAVHFTRGIPTMPGYESTAFADEWRAELEAASSGLGAPVHA